MISIGSSFLLDSMFTVLLIEKVSSLSAAHASNLLTSFSALAATLWFFVVIYIARLSAKVIHPLHFPGCH